MLIQDLTLREFKIKRDIKEIENTPGVMVFESVTKNKGSQTTKFKNRNKDGVERDGKNMEHTTDNTTHSVKPVIKRVMELQDVLTRVQGKKQTAIAQLHRMEHDDKRLIMDQSKLELYKQRVSGRLDLDTLFGDDDFGLDI